MSALAKPKITATEYLALERAYPELKSEFVEGEMFAMAGASEVHVNIVSNITGELYAQ
ncbi:MAG: Uma2 family endonuclease, partial [Methylococcales bacterium]|nr:Uma2 family endonuclease [Methylococcales bacterium]